MNECLPISDGFQRALGLLRDGQLVAVPTETVYGLAADATNDRAVQSIYRAKGRPSHNPLIVHVNGLPMASQYVEVNATAHELMQAFWPGPLTLVLPLKNDSIGLAQTVTAGLDTLAVRHPLGVMADLAGAIGVPIAAPSANTSGRISPTLAKHVQQDLGDRVALILDGGPCEVGLESTIVKITNDGVVLLREGGVTGEQIEKVLRRGIIRPNTHSKVESPGQLLAHYAPQKPLRLNATTATAHEAWLVFGATPDHAGPLLNLSPTGDLNEAAHNLFAMLKQLDESSAPTLAVHPLPIEGIGAAINDRLKRAAHGAMKAGDTSHG